MNKFYEMITERYLMKTINEITIKVCQENFDAFFLYCCKFPDETDTVLGQTYRKLEVLARKEVKLKFDELIDQIGIFNLIPNKDNPFFNISWCLWDNFLEDLQVNEFICCEISYLFHEKREELEKLGIIDKEGELKEVQK